MFSRLSLFLCALVVCTTASVAAPTWAQTTRTAILAADYASGPPDVASSLMATGRFAVIDVYPVGTENPRSPNPSLATLQAYDSVMVYNNFPYNDRENLGDVLHAYVDGGGVVVEMVFSTSTFGPLGGAWAANNDSVLEAASYDYAVVDTLGAVAQPLHPIMTGVSSLKGGARGQGALSPGSDLVASWANGYVLAATRNVGAGTVVGLNFFPVTTANAPSPGWDATTDGAVMMANALTLDVTRGPAPVPTLSEWAMILFGLILAGGAALHIQRRSFAL